MDCLVWGLSQALPWAAASISPLKEGEMNSLIGRAKGVALRVFVL